MEFILPKIYEEILERNFEEEALLLKDDQLMSILLEIHSSKGLEKKLNKSNRQYFDVLINNAYIIEQANKFYLTIKGINFLKLLGIPVSSKEEYLPNDVFNHNLYNYFDIKKIPKVHIFKNLSSCLSGENKFLKFNTDSSTLECTLTLNCIFNLNDFIENLKKVMNENTKLILHYQTNRQRNKYLAPKFLLLRGFFPIIDLFKSRLKKFYVNSKKLNHLLFYNSETSRAEVLGRLIYLGFNIIEEINGTNYNKLVVIPNPKWYNKEIVAPKYKRLIKLRRVGKNEKLILIYKFRTMFPYAEYLQDYYYQVLKGDLKNSSNHDFRITSFGRFLRMFWLDELPMVINLLKGEIKIVGVRPLSVHYFELYPSELRKLRCKYKPGLIPPFYVDTPTDLQGIFDSEKRYLDSFSRKPILTNIRYFFRAYYNIIFRKA